MHRLVNAAGDLLDTVDWCVLPPKAGAAGQGQYYVVKFLLELTRGRMATSSYTTERFEIAVRSWNHEEADRLNRVRLFEGNAPRKKMVAPRATASFGSLKIVQLLVDNGAQLHGSCSDEPHIAVTQP